MEIILKDLPKVSLNKFYAGVHWTTRKKMKDDYSLLVKSQFKHIFSKDKQYVCIYSFTFKNNPLDCSNTIGMVKMIEDIIFEDDKWDIVRQITIVSMKGKSNFIKITVDEEM